ncbi:hypothetical protein DCAR_0830582 [Daucus carota subsp. sativus]|uniref:Uncharacterized protein n=1 Tax=Daucus carota subsp. sativus TaxID=79200 RepID=A0A175YKR8_DAUCS|nr:PREDICTED: protein YLS3-like [Daucus carota subsp. sativus]WOH11103.1 hypothetical protein DCAR_0830582 [Daucus carota subsp. sativus]
MDSKALAFLCIFLAAAATLAVATMEQDENDCADQMANMAECIPYVSGSAKKPTETCCQDAEKVRSAKPKCLCVLIIESTDTSMGLPINTTLALQMPTACKSDAKVSDCPTLLNLPADSPKAKIFKLEGASPTTDSLPASASSSSSSSTPSSSSSTPASSGSGSETKTTTSTSAGGALLSGGILAIIGLASSAIALM